jgi:hypothetical protein
VPIGKQPGSGPSLSSDGWMSSAQGFLQNRPLALSCPIHLSLSCLAGHLGIPGCLHGTQKPKRSACFFNQAIERGFFRNGDAVASSCFTQAVRVLPSSTSAMPVMTLSGSASRSFGTAAAVLFRFQKYIRGKPSVVGSFCRRDVVTRAEPHAGSHRRTFTGIRSQSPPGPPLQFGRPKLCFPIARTP